MRRPDFLAKALASARVYIVFPVAAIVLTVAALCFVGCMSGWSFLSQAWARAISRQDE